MQRKKRRCLRLVYVPLRTDATRADRTRYFECIMDGTGNRLLERQNHANFHRTQADPHLV